MVKKMCNKNYELCDSCCKYKLSAEFMITESLKCNICVECINKKDIKTPTLEEIQNISNQNVYKQ